MSTTAAWSNGKGANPEQRQVNGMAKRDNEQAARALVDAALLGDKKAAEKHGITTRTLRNYRAALDSDDELSAALERCMREALDAETQRDRANWADETNDALVALTRETLDLWRDLRDRARSFKDRMRVLNAALQFIGQLSEPQLVREVVAGERRSHDQADQQPPQAATARDTNLGPN